MILPALFDHIDLIKEAKKNNYHVITCDNNPINLGHKYGDSSANISLLDFDNLLEFAEDNCIDAVMAFSTDIAAIPVAYIASKMNLVGNSVSAVEIMANKTLFRSFLRQNNFNTPSFQTVSCYEDIDIDNLLFPIIIKPTDRAGSKGVYIINDVADFKVKFDMSIAFSFEGRVIVEDYIEVNHKQIHGDALVQDGELIFCCLGDQFFGDGIHAFSPIATIFPTTASDKILKEIECELRRFIELVNYQNGGINIEIRVGKDEKIYFIEIAPRFGGNYIPKTINFVCGLNLIKYALDMAVGNKITIPTYRVDGSIFQFILRSKREGVFKSIHVHNNADFEILEHYEIKKTGDIVDINNSVSNIISVYILKVQQSKSIEDIINCDEKYFSIEMKYNG